MVEAKGEIEGRIAEPCAFGVEKHRPFRTDEDVFRRDVAMDQRLAVLQGALDKIEQRVGYVRMFRGSEFQIGLQPDRLEYRIVVEIRGYVGLAGSARMDHAQASPDLSCKSGVCPACLQLALPDRIGRGR